MSILLRSSSDIFLMITFDSTFESIHLMLLVTALIKLFDLESEIRLSYVWLPS